MACRIVSQFSMTAPVTLFKHKTYDRFRTLLVIGARMPEICFKRICGICEWVGYSGPLRRYASSYVSDPFLRPLVPRRGADADSLPAGFGSRLCAVPVTM